MHQISRIGENCRGILLLLSCLNAVLALAPASRAAELIPLRAGPVTLVFDQDNILLRYVRVGGHELLRGISAPVRDQNWATVAPKISNLLVSTRPGQFQLTFHVQCQEGDIDFRWKGTITGNSSGVIEYAFDGEAHSSFKRNRIGFCVLHGPSAAGKPWEIETADGKSSKGQFPLFISPHQPAKNLKAITHEVTPRIRARVEMQGDTFEMEDQRNWTDASFKTYCTPLEIPYPVELAKGTKVSQKIRISLEGDIPEWRAFVGPRAEKAEKTEGVTLSLTGKELPLPRLGLQVSSEVPDLAATQIERLKSLQLDHLRADLALSEPSYVVHLRRAAEQARALGVSLQVGLNLGTAPDFSGLRAEIEKLKPPVAHWLVIGTDRTLIQRAKQELASAIGEARLGMTEITNFVELNRARPEVNPSAPAGVVGVGFAMNPQVHAFDNYSLFETLPMHGVAVESARQFAGSSPLLIGPITLRPQLIGGKVQPGGPPPGRFPIDLDERQGTALASAWTLGSIKYLAEAGAHSATYFETIGWKGVIDADDVKSRPEGWPSRPGALFPVYLLLQEIGPFAGGTSRIVDSSDPLAAAAMVLQKGDKSRLLLSNLTGRVQRVTLQGFRGKAIAKHLANGNEFEGNLNSLIILPPYAIMRFDLLER